MEHVLYTAHLKLINPIQFTGTRHGKFSSICTASQFGSGLVGQTNWDCLVWFESHLLLLLITVCRHLCNSTSRMSRWCWLYFITNLYCQLYFFVGRCACFILCNANAHDTLAGNSRRKLAWVIRRWKLANVTCFPALVFSSCGNLARYSAMLYSTLESSVNGALW